MTGATLTQTGAVGQAVFDARDLETLFEQCFGHSHHTRLCGGYPEPLYRPASGNTPARLCYREDFFRSALHEVAHWCVAGPARRQREDFGYWYAPDGRDATQQRAFEAVEVRPQAFELVFCAAVGCPFRVSLDNLHDDGAGEQAFAERVFALACESLQQPPSRMGSWARCLSAHYRGEARLPDLSELESVLGGP